MQGLHDEHAVQLDGVAGLVFGEQSFVEFFARADADLGDLATGSDRSDEIEMACSGFLARRLRRPAYASMQPITKPNALIEGKPEAGHVGVGDGDASGLALLAEERDNAAAAADDVAVADAS